MKIGIIREGKIPPDSRVPLTPLQCAEVIGNGRHSLVVQASNVRSYKDAEFQHEGVDIVDDISDCDILLGVKEVPVNKLIEGKTYFMFSHTIKKQPYNRDLLRTILEKNITLIDYEVLTDDSGARLIAFGKFAGMVGAHNALWAYGQRTGTLMLPRMSECHDYAEVLEFYRNTPLPDCRIVLTGTGRVANGAAKVLFDMGYAKMDARAFLSQPARRRVFTQLGVTDYAVHKDGKEFEETDYFNHPEEFIIDFSPFYRSADILINGIYWDPKAPAFFSADEMKDDNFNICTIADITCDIAPESSIPSTLRAATIAAPVFGYDPVAKKETAPYQEGFIDMMTIDNLPNELPRDASEAFGEQFIEHILPELTNPNSMVLERGTIAANGKLGKHFQYLMDYVAL